MGLNDTTASLIAGEIAEAVRRLNYATLPDKWPGIADVHTVYATVGELRLAAERLPQACRQLATWLLSRTDLTGEPVEAAADLAVAAGEAEALAHALSEAHNAVSTLAQAPPDGPLNDR